MTALELSGVTFSYPAGKPVLRDLGLTVRAGRRLAIVGMNGTGKTTLLLHLNGILRPTSGRVLRNGQAVSYGRRFLDDWRRAVGMVLQNPDDQLFSASVLEDVSFGPLNLGLSEPEAEVAARAGLSAMSILHLADRATHDLSFGEKKRVAIAGILAARPDVILLDEPTSGLDARAKGVLMALLDDLHRAGTTLVMATHDLDLAYGWADDAAIIRDGTTLRQGEAVSVLADEAALDSAGLVLPAMARLDWAMRAKGMLKGGEPVRSLSALLGRLGNRGNRD